MSVDRVRIKPRQKFEGHTGRVSGVIHLPSGQQIMTCSYDRSLGVWNVETGKQISNWRDGKSPVRAIALSNDGKEGVSGSDEKIISSVCWNGDGVQVVSGSWDGTARVWDVETGKTTLEISTGFEKVYTAIFSPDLTLIATGRYTEDAADNGIIKIWDANTGKLVAILKGHTGSVYCLAWTANGRTLISGSSDVTIRTWNTSTWQPLEVLMGHTSTVYGIAISLNGHILASASYDNTARLWNLQNGQPIASPLQHPHWVDCVSFSVDGTLLATGCYDKNAYIWDILAIIKEAGLDELLEDSVKSFLDVDAIPSPESSESVYAIPTGFFDDTPTAQRPDSQSNVACSIVPPSVPNISDAPPEPEVQPSSPEPQPTQSRFLSRPHRSAPTLSTFLRRIRLPFFRRPQRHSDEGMEMQERPASIVNVPLAQGRLRVANADGVRRDKEKQKQRKKEQEEEIKRKKMQDAEQARISNNAENASTTSGPHITQPAAGPSRSHTSLEPQAVPTSPNLNTPVNASSPTAIGSSAPHAGIFIPCPRCCIPFLSCLGCISESPDGHH